MIGKSSIGVNVDGVPIAIMSNSLVYKKGFGTKNVRAASLGGGAVVSIHTENVEDKIGEVKFSIPNTDASIQLVTAWAAGLGIHTVNGIDVRGIPFNLTEASMTDEPEFKPTADGETEITFRGNPMPV